MPINFKFQNPNFSEYSKFNIQDHENLQGSRFSFGISSGPSAVAKASAFARLRRAMLADESARAAT
jgi:hypothetical protein